MDALCSRNGLLAVASEAAIHAGGLLVLDEAFVDVATDGSSLAPEVDRGHIRGAAFVSASFFWACRTAARICSCRPGVDRASRRMARPMGSIGPGKLRSVDWPLNDFAWGAGGTRFAPTGRAAGSIECWRIAVLRLSGGRHYSASRETGGGKTHYSTTWEIAASWVRPLHRAAELAAPFRPAEPRGRLGRASPLPSAAFFKNEYLPHNRATGYIGFRAILRCLGPFRFGGWTSNREFSGPFSKRFQDELLAVREDSGRNTDLSSDGPYVDTLKGSKHCEHEGNSIRWQQAESGEWAFAFDPRPTRYSVGSRGDKSGTSQGPVSISSLIAVADRTLCRAILERLKRGPPLRRG